MTYKDSISEMLTHCAETLNAKRKEYAQGSDFHNFEVTAKITGGTPEQALAGMMAKHTVSIYDMIRSGDQPIEKWQEKIGDHINYLLILWAMVRKKAEESVEESVEEPVEEAIEEAKPEPVKKPAAKKAEKIDHGKICAC